MNDKGADHTTQMHRLICPFCLFIMTVQKSSPNSMNQTLDVSRLVSHDFKIT